MAMESKGAELQAMVNSVDDKSLAAMVCKTVLGTILEASRSGGNEKLDPDVAVDGVIMALAALLEQAPEYRTNQGLRQGADKMAKRMTHYARGFRQVFAETGIHPINALLHDGTRFASTLN